MILFYSDYCPHCKMLIQNVQRLDANATIKLYNIDTYARPQQIQSVPALMILPSREVLYGRHVFDYLLLPSKGILVTGTSKPVAAAENMVVDSAPSEPTGFASTSSAFASIDGSAPLGFQSESWAWTNEASVPTAHTAAPASAPSTVPQSSPFGVETRDLSNKALPDMDAIMQRREQDLRNAA